jgi:PAS domain S-box-containing protein
MHQKAPFEGDGAYSVPVSTVTSSGGRATQSVYPSHDQVLDQVDLAVIATDAEGVVTHWNARAEVLYGWTRDEAIGRYVADLTVPEDQRRNGAQIIERLQAGESWQGSFRVRRKDGSVFTAYVKNSPILEGGRLIGIVGCSIEIADPHLASAVRSLISDGDRASGRRTRTLSPREREVLGMLARGLTGEQIAERLVLSPETVRTHIRNAREKLGASTRVEAVTMALLAREIQV